MTISEVNAMDEDEFLEVFGNVYEHSDWVAEAVMGERPFESYEELARLMVEVVGMVDVGAQLEMLMCYPEPGSEDLTEFSEREYKAVGLDDLDAGEEQLFTELLQAYQGMVGLPFILHMAGMDKAGVLRELGQRFMNAREVEFGVAMKEMHKIALHRIAWIAGGKKG